VAGTEDGRVLERKGSGYYDAVGCRLESRDRQDDQYEVFQVLYVPKSTERVGELMTCSWDLDTKPLKTVYQGLAARTSLVSLSLRFPSSRAPRPIVILPAIPNLRRLRVTNIDPLCYPDDLSVLILQSKKLQDLRMHWSPRMREEAEPSINLRSYFGKCLEAQYHIPLESLAFQNFYGVNTGDLQDICDLETIRNTEFINCFGGGTGSPGTIFVDETWKNIPGREYFKNFKRNRSSEISEPHAKILANISGLEELYLIGDKPVDQNGLSNGYSDGHQKSPANDMFSPRSSSSHNPSPGRTLEQANAVLLKQYLHILVAQHGQSIRKLLLHNSWALSGDQISELVSCCPHLEQLALGLSGDEPNAMRILAPFLTNLRCIRILDNVWLEKSKACDPELQEILALDTPEPMLWKIAPTSKIKWSGIGDRVFRVGKSVQVPDEDGRPEWKREIWRATWDDVKHIDIWRLDCMEI